MAKSCHRSVRPIAGMQVNKVVDSTKDGHTVFMKFASQFCGACQESKAAISEALTKTCAEVVEVDADVAMDVADAHKVENMPTVIAFRGGKAVGRLEGAETPEKYKAFFQKHSGG